MTTSDRNAPMWVTAALTIVGIVLVVIGIVYFAETAGNLPSFFPGHVASHSADSAHHHTKHGIAAVAVGIAAFIAAWISTGKKKPAA